MSYPGTAAIAIFHATLKVFSRAKGHAATAAAAYRAASKIPDDRTGVVHDYRRRQGVVSVHALVPPGSPEWANDEAKVWNAAEAAEVRRNANTARELEVALPAELSSEARQALALSIAQDLVDRYRVAVMVAIHTPGKGSDQRNHHAHLLFSTRVLNSDGFGDKVRVLDDRKTGPTEVRWMRAQVAERTNRFLERAGHAERVDHRTLAAQATEAAHRGDVEGVLKFSRAPTTQRGKAATALVRQGLPSTRHAWEARVRRDNRAVERIGRQRLSVLKSHEGQSNPLRTIRVPRATVFDPRRDTRDASIGSKAYGPDARLLNRLATQTQQGMRAARAVEQLYLDELRRVSKQIAEDAEAFIRRCQLSAADSQALLQSLRQQSKHHAVIRRVLDSMDALEREQQADEARRRALTQAMLQRTRARATVEAVERERENAWRPMTRRRWADRRRAERAALREAEAEVKGLGRGDPQPLRDARAEHEEAERLRRTWLPLPMDGDSLEDSGEPSGEVPEAPPMPKLVPRPRRPQPRG